ARRAGVGVGFMRLALEPTAGKLSTGGPGGLQNSGPLPEGIDQSGRLSARREPDPITHIDGFGLSGDGAFAQPIASESFAELIAQSGFGIGRVRDLELQPRWWLMT